MTENEIQKNIIKKLRSSPKIEKVIRINSGMAKMGGRTIQLAEKGTPDIVCLANNGKFVAVEVKTHEAYKKKNNGMSDAQVDYINCVNNCGGIGGVACSLDTLNEILERV